jgi:hypothetical protein
LDSDVRGSGGGVQPDALAAVARPGVQSLESPNGPARYGPERPANRYDCSWMKRPQLFGLTFQQPPSLNLEADVLLLADPGYRAGVEQFLKDQGPPCGGMRLAVGIEWKK